LNGIGFFKDVHKSGKTGISLLNNTILMVVYFHVQEDLIFEPNAKTALSKKISILLTDFIF